MSITYITVIKQLKYFHISGDVNSMILCLCRYQHFFAIKIYKKIYKKSYRQRRDKTSLASISLYFFRFVVFLSVLYYFLTDSLMFIVREKL